MSAPKFEMRVTPELRSEIDAAAKARGMSVAAWVKEQVQIGLHMAGERREPVDQFAGKVATARLHRRNPSTSTNGDCRHRNKKRLPYLTLCDDCGARL